MAALEDPATSPANWRWTSRHSGVIHASARTGDAISVQETWAPGWTATLTEGPRAGTLLNVSSDGLGLIASDVPAAGQYQIELRYTREPELGATTAASLFAMFAAGVAPWRGRRPDRAGTSARPQ